MVGRQGSWKPDSENRRVSADHKSVIGKQEMQAKINKVSTITTNTTTTTTATSILLISFGNGQTHGVTLNHSLKINTL